ncbi:M48 family metalloprotease [Halobacteria archaeon AArc-m2/3/4]|uniref:M48 family metalloprotease n=1 Tax=Natronoglomus mannanivorans TaxID=2979990 RepID=A0AAP3E380_9EURY|nr:M48 family metalloprotease [Halobacteria archaeon AArc-xg1-1]MCU4972959.1 M48 family metalloprotease [Halobacteria archaeon AArc-m2/3/4]
MVGNDLTARIGGTLALILAIDVAFALVVAALLEPWIGPLLASFGGRSYGLLAVLTLVCLLWIQLLYARRNLLAEADAHPVSAESHPDLDARITRLASLADMRVPAVAVADSDVPNSFAVGSPWSGTIVVSEGLLETLSDEELDAVLAHELVHLKNHDAAVMTLASFLPALVSDEYSILEDELPAGAKPVVLSAGAIVWFVLSSTFIDAPLVSASGLVQFVVATAVVVLVGGIALGLLATPVVFLSQSLSRQREFVADRDGARLVGDPGALVSALTTLDDVVTPPSEDARRRYDGLEGMCLLPYGFSSGDGDDESEDGFHVETRSHPPTEERIERLRELASTLERTAA